MGAESLRSRHRHCLLEGCSSDDVDFGETPRPFMPSLEDILCEEAAEFDVHYVLASEIDSVFDPDDFFSGKDLEFDVLFQTDSEIDYVLAPDMVSAPIFAVTRRHLLQRRPRT